MIIQTGMRTDIPAFYSQWLLNRIEALLPGGGLPGDTIHQAAQTSWPDPRLRLDFSKQKVHIWLRRTNRRGLLFFYPLTPG